MGPLELKVRMERDPSRSPHGIAYLDGVDAFRHGIELSANPHVPRTDSWRAWYRGYVSAGTTTHHQAARLVSLRANTRARGRTVLWVLAALVAAVLLLARLSFGA